MTEMKTRSPMKLSHPGVVHPDLCARRLRHLIERLCRRVPGIVGVVDEGPAEEGDR